MPNVSFDIFYDLDFINVTATRSGAAPKAKPAWKVRTAPKLPPKELPAPSKASPHPTPRPKINAQRNSDAATAKKPAAPKLPAAKTPAPGKIIEEVDSDTASVTSKAPAPAPAPKKTAPKLKDLPKKQ